MPKNEPHIVHYVLDPNNPPRLSPEERERLERTPVNENDSENPPLTDDELERMVTSRHVRLVREKTGLSQSAFATRYRVNLARLRDLEQGRTKADSAFLAYLKVIERSPDLVDEALRA